MRRRARARRTAGHGVQLYLVDGAGEPRSAAPAPAATFSLDARVVCLRLADDGPQVLVTGDARLPSSPIGDGLAPEQAADAALGALGVACDVADQFTTRVLYDPQPHAVVGVLAFCAAPPQVCGGRWIGQDDAYRTLGLLDAELLCAAIETICPDEDELGDEACAR